MNSKKNRSSQRFNRHRKSKLVHSILLVLILIGSPLLAQSPYYQNWIVRPDNVGSTEVLDLYNGNWAWHTTYNQSIEVTTGVTIGIKNDFYFETNSNNEPIAGAGTHTSTVMGVSKTVMDSNDMISAQSSIMNTVQSAIEIGLAVSGVAGLLEDGLAYLYSQGYGYLY
jgi:hypothetical protein